MSRRGFDAWLGVDVPPACGQSSLKIFKKSVFLVEIDVACSLHEPPLSFGPRSHPSQKMSCFPLFVLCCDAEGT